MATTCLINYKKKTRPGHTKDFKNGTYCLLVRRSTFKNVEGKLNTRSYQWTNPLL